MVNYEKTDARLGVEVNNHLKKLGIETPMMQNNYYNNKEQKQIIEGAFSSIMQALHLNLNDDSLQDTPGRVAKMYVDEIFYGLNYDNFPKITTVENKVKYNDMIIEKCTVKSTCEHHFVYFGTSHNDSLGCWVGYIPNEKVVGLSKINRIVDFFARRPQIQERLCIQIAETLKYILQVENVAVVLESQHFCVLTRGIQDSDGKTITSSLHGAFLNPLTRAEFMSFINK